MASGTRSSKRKSSPSISKKPRIKDRSKKRSKTLKGKSKKVSRQESSYSDSESLSSVSYSSSDTDSRRSRSRIRKDAKKKSRGSRFRSRNIDNTVNERRGKRSKKSKGKGAKKKSLRKKRKREPSISSSDRSVSCSTCRSSDNSEGENRKTEKRMKRSERDFDDYRRWGGHRSRSSSPCRLDGVDGRYLNVEQNLVENNPRRLRSIIIFAKEFEEEKEAKLIDKDVHKEEIMFDQDDYPSPRSNDSYDLHVQPEKIVGFKVEHDMITSTSDQAIVLGSIEVSEAKVLSVDSGSNPTDLEAVLRQKALENLKKFKGGVRPNVKKLVSTKSSIDGELTQSSSINGTLEWLKKDQEGSVGRNMGESSALNKSAAKILPILTQDSEMVNPSKEGSADVEKLEGGVGEVRVLKEGNIKEDKLAEQALPTHEMPSINMLTTESLLLPSRNGKGLTDSVDNVKGKQETVSLQRLGSHKLDSSMIPIEEASKAMSVLAKSKDVESEHPSNDAKLVTNDAEKTPTEGIDKTISNLERQSSNAKGKEEGDSQFQQKTMSVMRGGEMVQVNYKVYIPKNVPALARRKLKR